MKKIVFIILFAFILNACGKEAPPVDEKQRFIDATIEVSCLLMKSDNVKEDLSESKRAETDERVREIFEKHGFDAYNGEVFAGISLKYQDDKEVIDAVHRGVQKCDK